MEISKERTRPTLHAFRTKKSTAWSHFSETRVPARLKCMYCHKEINTSHGSTGNLIRHLKAKHPNVAVDKEPIEKDHSTIVSLDFSVELDDSHSEADQAALNINADSSTPAANVVTCVENTSIPVNVEKPDFEIVAPQEHVQYYLLEPMDHNKSQVLSKQLTTMIVKDLQLFSIVENPEFKKLVNILNPDYNLPSCKELKMNFLTEIYQTAVGALKSTLTEVTAVALTTDRWISINNESWISVTAYYLNKDFQFQSSFLSCISFPEQDSSSNIAAFLLSVAVEWGISDKVIAIVTEKDPSMARAAKECQWLHISCFASALDKIVIAGLMEINPLLQKIRQVVVSFKRNTAAQQMLLETRAQNNLSNVKMKSDIQTKWNSTFEMVAAFLDNKESIIFVTNKFQNISQLSTSEWTTLEKAVELLMIFNSVAIEISSESALSLSKVPYMVKFMVKHVSNILAQNDLPSEIESMAVNFKRELQNYSSELEANSVIGQNVLLDPRFKRRGFPDSCFEKAYSSLCKDVSSLKVNKINENRSFNQSKAQNNIRKPMYTIDMWSEFEEKKSVSQNSTDEAAIIEISAFMNDDYQSLSDNPLTYWGNKLNQIKFPALLELVKKRLCVPATAISGQIKFTKEGNTLLEKRKRLISNRVKEILFLNHNL